MWLITKFLEVLFGRLRSKNFYNHPDETLVKEYLATQDDQLFSILYNRYSTKIYAKCIAMLKNVEAAQDCTQEIFIKVLTNIAKFNQQSKFSTWLFSVAYNHCIDLIRKNKKQFFADLKNEHEDSIQEDIEDAFLMETKLSRLKGVLEKMDDENRTLLLMKYQDDLSIKEMGDILGKGESAVKMKIVRAKHRFKQIHDELFDKEQE